MSVYRILLPLSDKDPLADLVTLAGHFLPPEGGQIELMGVVEVPKGRSLSEGTMRAQECREQLMALLSDFPDLPLHVKPRVRVAHEPWLEIVKEVQDNPVDLLLIPWNGAEETVLGSPLKEILARTPCDLILCRGVVHRYDRILVPLRGGPHVGLTLRLAQALTEISGERVTLLSVTSTEGERPALERLKKRVHFEVDIVSLTGDPAEVILEMATSYHALVLGTSLIDRGEEGTLGDIPTQVLNQTSLPVFLVRSFRPGSREIPTATTPLIAHPQVSDVSAKVDRWFATNTFHWSEFEDIERLIRWKEEQAQTISLVLPALNEEETVGDVITTIKTALMEEYPLLDEIILMDSDSTDRTREIASSLGIPVYIHKQVLADEVGSYAGKGEALWKSLYVTKGSIIAWIDTDIVNIHPTYSSLNSPASYNLFQESTLGVAGL